MAGPSSYEHMPHFCIVLGQWNLETKQRQQSPYDYNLLINRYKNVWACTSFATYEKLIENNIG